MYHAFQPNSGPSSPDQRRDAIIDIGSNSIRMVVYVQHNSRQYSLFNESMKCRLGDGFMKGNMILPNNIQLAENALDRLISIARAMDLTSISAVGTAALRDATNGEQVQQQFNQRYDLPIEIISQRREAELVAQGVLSFNPQYEGFIADLGGASIEMVTIDKKIISSPMSVPYGILRLPDDMADFGTSVDRFINDPHNRNITDTLDTLCVTGGNWRYLAKVMMDFAKHPVSLIEGYSVSKTQALSYLERIIGMDDPSDLPSPGTRRKNAKLAAQYLQQLLMHMPINTLLFSANSIREGLYQDIINQQDAFAKQDTTVVTTNRWQGIESELWRWLIESNLPLPTPRILDAFLNQADSYWHYHPDLRADIAYMSGLYSPHAGLNHDERLILAYANLYRYNDKPSKDIKKHHKSIMSDEARALSATLGLASALAFRVSGGIPQLLAATTLRHTQDALIMECPTAIGNAIARSIIKHTQKLGKLAQAPFSLQLLP